MSKPKIFISYSWKPAKNKLSVMELAERLEGDNVHVIIDEWDLKEGQDKNQFMEQMVNNPEVFRVLLICNKEYAEKANSRKGGVGIESQIISEKIYNEVEQTKFLPIILEYEENGKPYVPTFVHSRVYIDLSNEETYEENYVKLVRNIYNKPAFKRPPSGTTPTYILEDEPIHLPTAYKINTIKNALINERKNASNLIKDYFDAFINTIELYSIDENELNNDNFTDIILKKITELRLLRDDFIQFVETYFNYSNVVNAELIHNFFEKLLSYLKNIDGSNFSSNTFPYLKNEHKRFFLYELFLTFAAMCLKYEKFDELAMILQTPYIIEEKNYDKITPYTYSLFRQYIYALDEYHNKKNKLNRVSVTADIIKQRATEKYNFATLQESDLVLYYISLLYPDTKRFGYNYWFPITSCYELRNRKVLGKAISKKYFDKIKVLFGVGNKEELITKVDSLERENAGGNHDYNYNIPNFRNGLSLDEMGTL